MYRALGAAALAIAIAAPLQHSAAQDPVGGAIIGGAAGAILGGVLDGGRGAAIGAIVGGATGAAIASQGQARPGGYRYYQQACYQHRGFGAGLWLRLCIGGRRLRLLWQPLSRQHGLDTMNYGTACCNCARNAMRATVAPVCGLGSL
jgi:hypothetical protein